MREDFRKILLNREAKKKMLAVLLDPDKCQGLTLASTIAALKTKEPDLIFIGGSLASVTTHSLIEILKEEVKSKVVLFPGNASQFAPNADALLFISLISGRNPDYLIGQQVLAAKAIKNSDVEIIPTGYILVDGGKVSATEYISNTRAIPRDQKDILVSTALAGELLGMHAIYLEAGSGAKEHVPADLIKRVSEEIEVPLIVGGGIRSVEDLGACYEAGADIVVIGNFFEEHPEKILDFVEFTEEYSAKLQEESEPNYLLP